MGVTRWVQGVRRSLRYRGAEVILGLKGGAGMKLRLDVSSERYDELAGELRGLGIEIDEGAGLVLSEVGRYADYLVVRVPSGG